MDRPKGTPDGGRQTTRLRREPPAFRRVTVDRVERRGARMARVTLVGPELEGLVIDQPAASVRLLLPSTGAAELVMPSWNGNEFLLPDGRRPVIRTFTPIRDAARPEQLDVDIVLHGGGAASGWAQEAGRGTGAAVSGPGRGYVVDPGRTGDPAGGFLLVGDETALPAIAQLLGAIPPETAVRVLVEVAAPSGRLDLPAHPRATVHWCDLPEGAPPGDALVTAVRAVDLDPADRIWAAGEAAGVQRIRRHLFEERGVARSRATVRGYWKHGRAGHDDAD